MFLKQGGYFTNYMQIKKFCDCSVNMYLFSNGDVFVVFCLLIH